MHTRFQHIAIIIKIKLSKQLQPSISRLNSRLLGQWNMSTISGGQSFISYNNNNDDDDDGHDNDDDDCDGNLISGLEVW